VHIQLDRWNGKGGPKLNSLRSLTINADSIQASSEDSESTTGDTVATVNGTAFNTLKEAFDAVDEMSETSITITIISDCDVKDSITIPSGKNITLNLNGKTITNLIEDNPMFSVESLSFTINGTITGSKMVIPTTNDKAYGFIWIASKCNVVINAGSYEGNTNGPVDEDSGSDYGALIRIGDGFEDHDPTDSTVVLNNVYMKSERNILDTNTLDSAAETITLEVNGGEFYSSGRAFHTDTWYLSKVRFTNATVETKTGPCIEVSGSYAEFNNCNMSVVETNPISYYITAIGLGFGGAAVIESGNYSSAHGYGLYIYTSGGFVELKGGSVSGGIASLRADNSSSYTSYYGASTICVEGGETYGNWQTGGDGEKYIIASGGTHTIDVTPYIAEGYKITQTGGSYVVNVDLNSISFSVENNRRGETIVQPVPSTKATIDATKTKVEWTFEGQHYSDSMKIAPTQAGLYTATITVYDENGTSGTATASYQFNNTHTVTLKYDGTEKTLTVLHNSTIADLPTPGKSHYSYVWTDADGSEFKSTDKVIRDLDLTATLVMSDIDVVMTYVREDGNVYIQAVCTPAVDVSDMTWTWAINYGDPSSVDRVELTNESRHYRFEMSAKTSDGTLARAVWEDDLCKTTSSSTETIQTDSEKVSIVPSDISDTAIDQTIDFNMPDIAEDEKVTISIKGNISDTGSTVDVSVQDIIKNGQTWTDGMSAAVDVTVSNVKSGYSLEITVKVQIPDNYLGAVAYYYNESRGCLEKVNSSIDEETGLVTIYTDHNTSYTVQVLTTDSPDPVVPDEPDTPDVPDIPIYDDDDDWYPVYPTVTDNNKNDDSKTAVACAAAAVVAALMAAFLVIDSRKDR